MSETTAGKHLAHNLETNLDEFLNLSFIEQLEKSSEFFRRLESRDAFKKTKNISSVFNRLADSYKVGLENANEKEKEFFQQVKSSNFETYLSTQVQYLIQRLPYYLLFTHLIFDKTYMQITDESREELRKLCGLTTRAKRQEGFTEFFNFLLREKVIDGGSDTQWSAGNKLYFLSLYERSWIVLNNARNEYKVWRDASGEKLAFMEAKQRILGKYRIPEHLWSDIQIKKNEDCNKTMKVARKWAKKQFLEDIILEPNKKIGLSDSYLVKILESARQEALSRIGCPCKNYENHKLIFVVSNGQSVMNTINTLEKESIEDIKFDSFVDGNHKGMTLYFCNAPL
jgi:hypothetical protein